MSKQRVEEGNGNKFDLQDRLVAFAVDELIAISYTSLETARRNLRAVT